MSASICQKLKQQQLEAATAPKPGKEEEQQQEGKFTANVHMTWHDIIRKLTQCAVARNAGIFDWHFPCKTNDWY
jgi:hypothetical protein